MILEFSTDFKEAAVSLNKVQAEIKNVTANVANDFFKSTYADLAACWDAIRGPLTKNGFSIVQGPSCINDKWVCVTQLVHTSGQWARSYVPILSSKADAQGFGSGLTYARRYGLNAMVGLADIDDDGNSASGKGKEQNEKPKEESKSKTQPQEKPKTPQKPPNHAPQNTGKPSLEELKMQYHG